jgi:glutamine synthetase
MSLQKDTKDFIVAEYVWIAGDKTMRSKCRTLYQDSNGITVIPEWNYDGSSTKQVPCDKK